MMHLVRNGPINRGDSFLNLVFNGIFLIES